MKKQYLVILGVIGLFITITGASFAYFMLNNSVNELETDVTAALLASVEFEGGQEVVVPESGIYPGWKGVQTFHVNKPDGYTSGTGSYQIQMETTIATEFQDWITIELYKTTTPSTHNVIRTEGDIVSSPDNALEIFASDSVKYNNFIEDTDCILKDELTYTTPKYVIDSTTGTITIEVENFDISTMEDTTYYVVYRFTNEDENQNGAQGANFKTKIVINNGLDIKPAVNKPNEPVLSAGLIPVVIDETTGAVTKANTGTEWYNYDNKKWANAVTVNDANASLRTAAAGTSIPMAAIQQMYVWIPRYEYTKSTIENAQSDISINFVDVNTTSTTEQVNNDDTIVHPVFCWGNYCQTNRAHEENIELPGLWIGKFEQGTDNTIKPGQNSATAKTISKLYASIITMKNANGLDATSDIHMMKNMEWGAVAYFTQSLYGICTTQNVCPEIAIAKPGTTGASTDGSAWYTTNGKKTSTTSNITGIYDMSGGRWEYMMSVVLQEGSDTDILTGVSGFTNGTIPINQENKRYYDTYIYGTTYSGLEAYQRSHYGDAVRELYLNPDGTLKSPPPNWNGNDANFASSSYPFVVRGGIETEGLWASGYSPGDAYTFTARSVLSVEQ